MTPIIDVSALSEYNNDICLKVTLLPSLGKFISLYSSILTYVINRYS